MILFVSVLLYILLRAGVECAYSDALGRQIVNLAAGAYGNANQQVSCIRKFAEKRYNNLNAARFLNRHPVDDCDGYGHHCSMYAVEVPRSRRLNISVPLLIFVFEGTTNFTQLLVEAWEALKAMQNLIVGSYAYGKVNRYFKKVFDKLWPFVQYYIQNYPGHHLWFLGHSLGGTAAALAAFFTRVLGLRTADQIEVITLGEPRVGNPHFAFYYDQFVPHSSRVVNGLDLVPHLYPCVKDHEIVSAINAAPGCDQHDENGYYHHGREKWYNRGTDRTGFRDCGGEPKNEDISCSNSHDFGLGFGLLFRPGSHFATHRTYFGHWLWYYGVAGCDSAREQILIQGHDVDEALDEHLAYGTLPS
ncbi:lipase (class 3) domain-containing protein [Ditylenchus destructor]|uniref:Lipase (Class 3) domain-containing protein n=1 Tax=Ditylenchus destructor TaxID=166010 RepID=A0AAD4MYM0_9BILA|nr:lipase (class 3) domain-containing protein [Ditylenchus destructor]